MAHQSHLSDLFLELDGAMTFERFAKEALYHPRFGYYSSNIATVGRRGDFSTSATISGILAKAIVRWASLERRLALGQPAFGLGQRWHVIEVGAGDGSLARDFLSHVSRVHRPLLTYHIVETSEPLRLKQREKLPKWQVRWHSDMISALKACQGEALIFSNELVDAFPPCAVRWNEGRRGWDELIVRDQGVNGLAEDFRPMDPQFATAKESSVFGPWPAEKGVPLQAGQRCEFHRSFRQWQYEWLPYFERGAVLTIDYGAPFPALYKKRPKGTIRGYFQQVRLEGMEVYDRFGHQDLTCDVNFTDLQQWGEAQGLNTVGLIDQRAFLLEMLPILEDPKLQQQDPALELLMSPYGAGKAFCALRQRKE